MSNAHQRLLRLEELRRDLRHREGARRVYALETLLAQLWVKEGRERLEVACVLLDAPPLTGKAEASLCASRLCSRLCRREADVTAIPTPPPAPAELTAWFGSALAAVLTEALDTLKAVLHSQPDTNAPVAHREIEVCREALHLAEQLRLAEVGDCCVRALRLLPPNALRETGATAREITLLRESACRALGAISPDALFLFWYTLGSPDLNARRDLLPALDYLSDARAVPYLIRLLERRWQWTDGEMMGWFIVRAFERIGDRKAIPALWRVASPAAASVTSVELAREARRVIEAIEGKKAVLDRERLLRPAEPPTSELLRAAESLPSEIEARSLVRPADPERDELLRPGEVSAEHLLRPASEAAQTARDSEELLRGTATDVTRTTVNQNPPD